VTAIISLRDITTLYYLYMVSCSGGLRSVIVLIKMTHKYVVIISNAL